MNTDLLFILNNLVSLQKNIAMITWTMTWKEMYDNLANDKSKVDFFMNKRLPKAIKSFREESRFPNWKCYQYTHPTTRNDYIVYFYAESRAKASCPDSGSFVSVIDKSTRYIIRWGASPYKHTDNSNPVLLRQLQIYTLHFFQRYNERFLKKTDLSANEVASIYLARNTIETPIEMNEKVNKNMGLYNEFNCAFKIRDGGCFAESKVEGIPDAEGNRENDKVDAISILHKTYLSASEIKEIQQEEINRQNVEAWQRLREDLSSDDITFTLEP